MEKCRHHFWLDHTFFECDLTADGHTEHREKSTYVVRDRRNAEIRIDYVMTWTDGERRDL